MFVAPGWLRERMLTHAVHWWVFSKFSPLHSFTDVPRIHTSTPCKSPNHWWLTCDNVQYKHSPSAGNSSVFCKSLLATKPRCSQPAHLEQIYYVNRVDIGHLSSDLIIPSMHQTQNSRVLGVTEHSLPKTTLQTLTQVIIWSLLCVGHSTSSAPQ